MSLKIASSQAEKRSIYEIFRSCRLCGAGGGYKMPIIQNVVDLDDTDVELSQKIKECVQIEVAIDDKMPPLICELCIDKINDFYAFQSLCKNTNCQTRARLGLPQQNRSSSPVEESILGVTEALCDRESSDNEPIVYRSTLKPAKGKPHSKSKKVAVKVEKEQTPPIKATRRSSPPPAKKPEPPARKESRPLKEQSRNGNVKSSKPLKSTGSKSRIRFESSSSTSPPPIRITRTKTSEELFDELTWDTGSSAPSGRDSSPLLVEMERKSSKPGPKSKQVTIPSAKGTNKSQPTKEAKVVKEKVVLPPVQITPKVTNKTVVKIVKEKVPLQPVPTTTPKTGAKKDKVDEDKNKSAKKRLHEKESPKPIVPAKKAKPTTTKQKDKRDPPKSAPKALPTPPVPLSCDICSESFMSNAARQNHARTHVVTFTEARLACNACEDWFSTYDEAAAHHKWHRTGPNPYTCSVCGFDYDTLPEYNVHIETYSCRKLYEEPDVQCLVCWNDFPTKTSLENHPCLGEAGRPGGKCSKCSKMYALLKDLIDHESTCTKERRIDPMILYKIKPTQILVANCDKLLERKIGLRYNVANVPHDYGVDPNCYYPYLKKQKRGIIKIKTESTPLDGMVNITDDIRKQFEEYENSDILSEEEDDDFELFGLKPKKIKKLSNLCLKTISNMEKLSKSLNSKRKNVKTEAAFDDLIDDQPAFSQSYNFDSLIDSLDEKNEESGEESVIKGFVLSNESKIKDDISKYEKSPKKDSSFDIDSLLRSDSDNKDKSRNENDTKSSTEAMDVDVASKSDNDINLNDIDHSKEKQSKPNDNTCESLESNLISPGKEVPSADNLKINDSLSINTEINTETDETTKIENESTFKSNGIEINEKESQKNDQLINQSDNQSQLINDKIESNGVSDKTDIS